MCRGGDLGKFLRVVFSGSAGHSNGRATIGRKMPHAKPGGQRTPCRLLPRRIWRCREDR